MNSGRRPPPTFMGRAVREAERPISVLELNRRVKTAMERGFGDVLVEGELSRVTWAASGHVYFALRDDDARVDAVIWSRTARGISPELLEEGAQVVVRGQATLYPPQGRYQLVVQSVQPAGEGARRAAFMRLKAKLEAEGLLDLDRKRELPALPRRVGIVTSPTGAALHDILEVLRRRFPTMDVLLSPARVQGEGAAHEVREALQRLCESGLVDVAIVGRGGGSMEDLWTFNDEALARAIAAAPIPVVSAVGHEIDVTIADLVADRRALTPSEAAELVVPEREGLASELRTQQARLARAVERRLAEEGQRLDSSWLRLTGVMAGRLSRQRTRLAEIGGELKAQSPVRRVRQWAGKVAVLRSRFLGAARARPRQIRGPLSELSGRLFAWPKRRPEAAARARLDQLGARLDRAAEARIAAARESLTGLNRALSALDPHAVLERGYSITLRDGRPVREGASLEAGAELETRFGDGVSRRSRVSD